MQPEVSISDKIRILCRKEIKSFSDGTYYETQWGFDPEVLMLGPEAKLVGFFQSRKYFRDIEDIIRNDFRLHALRIDGDAAAYAEKIASSNAVSVHIRRGDYVSSSSRAPCSLDYIYEAFMYMRRHITSPYFFVFSDDIEWCRRYIQAEHCCFVDIQEARKNPVLDFHLIRLCRHHIISNSTFSWWAAWLSELPEKIVVAPQRWFYDNHMNKKTLEDMIPKSWHCIDA
jgi:hypothetical protein